MATAGARKAALNLKGSYWFIPALLSCLAFLLAMGTLYLDRTWFSQGPGPFGWFEAMQPEAARAQLNVVASAMITVTSTLFGITIAAVAFASGNYGPRLLNNFMNDRGNQVSLGVFIATFVYNLMLLRAVRDAPDPAAAGETAAAFVPQLSMLVSSATMVVSVAVLIYFLHHIPASIRINSVLSGIGRHLIAGIEERFPDKGSGADPREPAPGIAVAADQAGYVEVIDFASLDEVACRRGATISLKARTGDFVHPHRPLVEIAGIEPDAALEEQIRSCFSLGEARTPTQDLEFLIDELVEIGLRALSPGVNDPFTAVTSLHWMGAAMAKLAERDLRRGPEQERYDPERVQIMSDHFRHYLDRSFGAIRPSIASSPIASKMFLDALWGVAEGAISAERREALREEAHKLVRQAETALKGPALEEVQGRLVDLERKMREQEK